jgi:energy-converting hydrogenase Eha subunit E
VPRVENLFALAALAYLAIGLYTGTYAGFEVLVGKTQVPGLRFQVLFYGVAALFGVFAFLNSIGYIIQLSPTVMIWHFWLSFVGVTLCFIGGAIFRFGAENAKEPWTLGVNAIAFSVGAGLLAFLSVQLWLALDLVRAVLRLKTS